MSCFQVPALSELLMAAFILQKLYHIKSKSVVTAFSLWKTFLISHNFMYIFLILLKEFFPFLKITYKQKSFICSSCISWSIVPIYHIAQSDNFKLSSIFVLKRKVSYNVYPLKSGCISVHQSENSQTTHYIFTTALSKPQGSEKSALIIFLQWLNRGKNSRPAKESYCKYRISNYPIHQSILNSYLFF